MQSAIKFAVGSVIVGAGIMLSAHDVISTKITWSREISRIVYKRCASCHHDGGSAFSLITYEESRPWAKAIKEEVLERRMPPFGAVKGFGEFKNDEALTQEELHLIADWVEGGSPEGESNLMPPKPDFKQVSAAKPKTGGEVLVAGSFTLKHPLTLAAVHPKGLSGSVRAIAERPDGVIEPLIWLYDYKPEFERTFYFRSPVSLPAGTKIEMFPPSAGSLALLKTR
jgi:hypothetical protein